MDDIEKLKNNEIDQIEKGELDLLPVMVRKIDTCERCGHYSANLTLEEIYLCSECIQELEDELRP